MNRQARVTVLPGFTKGPAILATIEPTHDDGAEQPLLAPAVVMTTVATSAVAMEDDTKPVTDMKISNLETGARHRFWRALYS